MRRLISILAVGLCVVVARAQTQRVPEPTPQAQQDAEKLVREVFKDGYARRSVDDRHELAVRLLEEGRVTRSDSASQYVLFREARDIAMQVGDAETALAAITEMGKIFAVDTSEQKLRVLTTMRGSVRAPDAAQAAAEAALALVDEAVEAGNYETANRAVELLSGFATAARSMPLVAEAQARRQEMKASFIAEMDMKIAAAKLRQDPNDRPSQQAMGVYIALYKNEWDKALPMLAAGPDGPWTAAAKADLANPADAGEMTKVADAWYELGAKNPAIKRRVWARADFWYNNALSSADGLARTKILNRLDQIAAAKTGAAGGTAVISDTTRKALPTQAELNRLKDLYQATRSGNAARTAELYQLRSTLFSRLQQDIITGTEADFFARCKGELQIRRIMEAAGDNSTYTMPLISNFSSFAQNAKTQEELAARLVALERFISSEKPQLDASTVEQMVESSIRTFCLRNSQFRTPTERVRLCTFLRSKGVRNSGLDKYRASVERLSGGRTRGGVTPTP